MWFVYDFAPDFCVWQLIPVYNHRLKPLHKLKYVADLFVL